MAPLLKWTGLILLATAIVGIAAVAGPRLAGETETPTDLGRVSIELEPSVDGGLEGYVPVADWGIQFEGPAVPLRTRAELRSLNRDALLAAADGERAVIDATEADLRGGLRTAVLRSLAWSLGIALLLLLVATLLLRGVRHRWALPVIGITIFVVSAVTTGLIARASFDRSSFENPTFFASGSEVQRILEVIDQTEVESPYGNEFEGIVRSIGAVLATDGDLQVTGRQMYLGSDLHANPLVIRPVSRLVGGEPVLMTGDFGQRGGEAESAVLAPRVAALGRRVVAVSGNHDSARLMRKLADQGVTVLDRQGTLQPDGSFRPPPVIDVDGVSVAGFGDPLEYGGSDPLGDRAVSVDDLDDPDAAIAAWVGEMLRWFDSLERKPDLLMIHQNSLATLMAEALNEAGYERPLTIATGHTHRQQLEKIGSTVVVNPGSIGAGGAFDAGEAEIGLAHLRFGEDGSLRSAELISVEPFSGAARATRVVIESLCPDQPRCSAFIPDEMVSE